MRRLRKREGAGIGLAIVAAIAAGELAVLLLRPKVDLSAVKVSDSTYFARAELERAREFASGQRAIAIGSLIAEGALLVLLVVRPPKQLLSRLDRLAGGRVMLVGAAGGALLAAVVALVGLPFSAAAHSRAVEFDLSNRSWGSWLSDWTLSTAITVVFAAVGFGVALTLIRRFGSRWWLPGSALVVVTAAVFVWLAPVVISPLFNRYSELPAGKTRSDLIALAAEQGVDVNDVLVVDASRRTNAVNAYVTGLGSTKRIVVYDTLLDQFSEDQVRLVVAHELAHVKQHDILRGLAWLALFAPAALYAVMLLTRRWARRVGAQPGQAGSLPPLALALALVSFAGLVISNQLSRRVEARADQFALEATAEPDAYIEMERQLAKANLSDPSPPALTQFLFGTHPTVEQRIGAALAYEHAQRLKGR